MDEATIRLALEIFTVVVVTGLGGKELFAKYQEARLKRDEKLLDYELSQDGKGLAYAIEQAKYYREQAESLQAYYQRQLEQMQVEKFAAIQADMQTLISELSPCKEIVRELMANRQNTTELIHEVLMTNRTQNEALKLIMGRLRLDKNKMDSTGQMAELFEAMSETPNRREKIQTGEWLIHPHPNEE
jgi:hypothetical protein